MGLIGGRGEEAAREVGEEVVREVREEVVRYSCSQPPDIIPRGLTRALDSELEEVSITLEGLQVVAREEGLPEHIQKMVEKAMQQIDQ